MDPLISVLTVCRNAEHEIGATIRSLVDQDSDCHEWVVIDGSSSDGTLACIAKSGIASRRVTSEPDHGIFDAMNKAVTMARGKWVYFLNAGDELADPRVLRDVATTCCTKSQVVTAASAVSPTLAFVCFTLRT
jgi:glycosyltransferase involved in cell wall biosynthesis